MVDLDQPALSEAKEDRNLILMLAKIMCPLNARQDRGVRCSYITLNLFEYIENVKINLTICLLGNFASFFCRLVSFSKSSFSSKNSFKNTIRVCILIRPGWSASKRFAKVISRRH